MRLEDNIRDFLKNEIIKKIPGAEVYLFGSRTDDQALGGDIDILILTKDRVDRKIFRSIRVEFFKKFGWQKLDLVSFPFDDQSPFRKLIESEAILL
jgi:predicted nucleotidyltransferase